MKPYFNLLMWIAIGLSAGLIVSFLLSPQAPPAAGNETGPINLSVGNQTENDTIVNIVKKPVSVFVIDSPCEECNYDGEIVQQVLSTIAGSSFLYLGEAKNITYPSAEASELISAYNLTALPAIIISGEPGADQNLVTVWLDNVGTAELDGALVSRNPYPPYYDIAQQRAMGLVNGIAIRASNCTMCYGAEDYIPSLEDPSIGFVFTSKPVLDAEDPQAQLLIEQYNITKLPVLLMDDGFRVYPLSEEILPLGTSESAPLYVDLAYPEDSWFVLREIKPPYEELPSHAIRGLVDGVYIVNSSCEDCFNASNIGAYFSQYTGLYLASETNYEANSTKALELIEKYHLTSIPAVLFSSEASVYLGFAEFWNTTNNSVESDGWYVFRNYQALGSGYQNLSD